MVHAAPTTRAVTPIAASRTRCDRTSHVPRMTPAATSAMPRPMTTGRVGTAATSTKPVRNVPAMAPTVPIADSRPTTDPVRARSRSWILTTVGLTADSTAAGTRQHRVVKATMPTGSDRSRMPPAMPTMGTTAKVNAPPRMSNGPTSRRGSTRSARRPPAQVPSAMPARIVPMMPVHVSRVTPRYGASNRPARISSTRTAAEVPRTTSPASHIDIHAGYRRAAGRVREATAVVSR